jgi:UDP-glucose 4-epimerase/UDP-arabinose 4-epimerase
MSLAKGSAVLVTGGAGYIGSHTAKALAEEGFLPVVYDDLSSGARAAVRWGPFVHGDVRDVKTLSEAISTHGVRACIHFAGLIEVGRSVARPDLFWDVNVGGTIALLSALREAGVDRLVFSSSAAVYGDDGKGSLDPIAEDAPKAPASPYGDTKLACEWMIEAACRAFGLSAVALRYFNACGADPSGLIGEAHDPETHLIPLAIAAGLGRRPPLTLFGTDYPTLDGSCLRDYIHVSDLATAHIAALRAPLAAGQYEAANVGSGHGLSVIEIIEAVGQALGHPVPYELGARRAGDPPALVAHPGRAQALLGWRAERSGLRQIVADALRWEKHPAFGSGFRETARQQR